MLISPCGVMINILFSGECFLIKYNHTVIVR